MKGPAVLPDLVLVGGGLANGLLAYRLAQRRPDLRVLVLESGPTFGGNHTWSFHETDLSPSQRTWTAPFVDHRWPFYQVAFPGLRRRVDLGYCSATSERLHRVLVDAGISARRADVDHVTPRQVRLSTGEVLEGRAVVDGRGGLDRTRFRLGWQKFLGQELRTARPHRLSAPILMDATVAQHDGFRFVYVLPFAADRLLVEDTYYSSSPDLDAETLRSRMTAYAHDMGWAANDVVREEAGVLPITLAGDIDAFWNDKHGQPCTGLRAGLFHATTGFSWPDAVRLADHLAECPSFEPEPLFTAIRAHAEARWRSQAFFRGLNRMLFLAGDPARRRVVMQRFYGFGDALVGRFYAGALSPADKLRLVVGRPPVPIAGAVRALVDRRVDAH